ncbi:MAG: methionyl-tRNA formyltransferase [Oligoflexia bacterium]|nr:methionyl-tRNA formyltransferase [Oligoflexia bacterium]
MLRVVFMGTPEFAVPALEAVRSRHEIVAVYTQADKPVGRGLGLRPPPVKSKALELGLPVFQPEKLTDAGEFDKLAALRPDIIIVVAYGKILRRNILELPRLGCVNIHSSLLPRWRGAAPIQWAILAGDRESGVTTMHLVEELDAGDILLQARTPISAEDTAGSLHDRLAKMGSELILPTLEGLEQGTLRGVSQDASQVTHASKLTKEMEWLDPAQSARELELRVRGLSPWPGTSLWVKGDSAGQRLKVKKARLREDIQGPEGKIFERAGMLLLGTRQGSLELVLTQWEGKKEVDAGAFLNGLRGKGESLPLAIGFPGPGTSG